MHVLDAGQCAVILLNYKGAADTLACLEALARLEAAPRRIIVVDNGSGEGEVARLKDGWTALNLRHGLPAPAMLSQGDPLPAARYILLALEENGGFSSGNNTGLRLAMQDEHCRAFWLLNNDTQPEPHALQALVTRANEAPDAGMVGSTIVWFEPSRVVQCAGGGAFNAWLGSTRQLAEGLPRDEVAVMPVELLESCLDFVCGASLLVRREVLERVGLLEESYFLYYEEVEWCLRVRKAGFRCAWARESVVLHREGASTGAASAGRKARYPVRSRFVDYLSQRNRLHLMRRHYPAAVPVVLASLGGVLLNRLRRGQADRFGLVLRAAWDGLRGKMGRPHGV